MFSRAFEPAVAAATSVAAALVMVVVMLATVKEAHSDGDGSQIKHHSPMRNPYPNSSVHPSISTKVQRLPRCDLGGGGVGGGVGWDGNV